MTVLTLIALWFTASLPVGLACGALLGWAGRTEAHRQMTLNKADSTK